MHSIFEYRHWIKNCITHFVCVFDWVYSITIGQRRWIGSYRGLGDQSAFGTRSSTFLSKITYLIGAAFIVATIFLFKLSIPTKSLETMVMQGTPDAQHTHEHNGQPCEHEHEQGNVPHAAGVSEDAPQVGMQKVAEEEKQTPGVEEMPATDAQKETGK